MSRVAKKIKLEQNGRSKSDRREVKQSLYSGQFMTSRLDDNEVNHIVYLFIFSYFLFSAK